MGPRIGDRVTGKLPFADREITGTVVDFDPGDPEAMYQVKTDGGQRRWVLTNSIRILTEPTQGPWIIKPNRHGELMILGNDGMTLIATIHPHNTGEHLANARRIVECGF